MKSTVYTLGLLFLVLALTGIGCYTQVGSTRDDRFSGEYGDDDTAYVEESPSADDSTGEQVDQYFDQNGNPRDRWYLYPYTAPIIVVGGGWYDPWYYYPWYNDPFWCWNPPISYYSPWWYPSPWYSSWGWYGGGGGGWYDHHRGGYATTRGFGSTRRSGSGRGMTASPRGGIDGTTGRTAPSSLDLPVGARGGSAGQVRQEGTAPATKPRTEGRKSTSTSTTRRVEGGRQATTGTRSRDAARTAPRRPSRGESQAPAPSNPGYSSPGSGRSGSATPAPSSPPRSSGGESGTRGGGSTRGGGGGGGRR